jgi:hypothetical protein
MTYLDKHIPVTVLIEDIRVHQLELADFPAPIPTLLLELLVWVLRLRVFVEVLHVGMGGGGVEVVVHLLDVFSVVAYQGQLIRRTPARTPVSHLDYRSNRTASPSRSGLYHSTKQG